MLYELVLNSFSSLLNNKIGSIRTSDNDPYKITLCSNYVVFLLFFQNKAVEYIVKWSISIVYEYYCYYTLLCLILDINESLLMLYTPTILSREELPDHHILFSDMLLLRRMMGKVI